MYLIMVVMGCEFWGFLSECKAASCSDCPVNDSTLNDPYAIQFHEQQEDAVAFSTGYVFMSFHFGIKPIM